jgi:hypothetical protein
VWGWLILTAYFLSDVTMAALSGREFDADSLLGWSIVIALSGVATLYYWLRRKWSQKAI